MVHFAFGSAPAAGNASAPMASRAQAAIALARFVVSLKFLPRRESSTGYLIVKTWPQRRYAKAKPHRQSANPSPVFVGVCTFALKDPLKPLFNSATAVASRRENFHGKLRFFEKAI
jgi:hypothetical protein